MARPGSTTIEEVYNRQIAVGQAVERLRQSGDAQRLAELEKDLAAAVVAVREGGDVAAILQAERALLRDEYDRFANTATMKGGLETALEELDAALATVAVVGDADAYRVRVDETHRVRKHRIGDVPKDDARMFFRGHRSRLSNLTKARGTDGEKAVLLARGASMRVAEKIYASLQREALGIGDRGRGGRQDMPS